MKIDVIPTVSVNNVKFGMDREAVRSLLGSAEEFYKTADDTNATDGFGFCHVFYDDNDQCEAIEIFNEAEVYVNGTLLFPVELDSAKLIIDDFEQDDDGLISYSKSIGIYSPDGEMESIFFGKEGIID